MDRATHQRIALVLGSLALLAGLASALVPDGLTASLIAVLGFAALAGGLHVVRPRVDRERADNVATGGQLLGVGTAAMMAMLGLLLVAAAAARFGSVRYLGEVPLLLSENFTLVTGPLTAMLAGTVLMAARDNLALPAAATPDRRWLTAILLTLGVLATLFISLPLTPGEPWQAPYVLGLAAFVAWLDAVHLAGLPRPTHVGSWLERGETRHSRIIVEGLARAGNGAVLIAGLGGTVFLIAGYPMQGMLTFVVASLLLVLTTHSAASLTNAVPEALSDVSEAAEHKDRLRVLSVAPIAVIVLASILTLVALASVSTGGSLANTLALLQPAIGLAIAALAGVNLARAGMPSFDEHGPARRAVSATAISVLTVSAFFSLLLELGIVSGPITDQQFGLVFGYAGLLGAALFVHARGLFPVPGMDLSSDEEEHELRTQHGDNLQRRVVILYAAAGLFLVASIGLVGALVTGHLGALVPESSQGRNAAFLGVVAVGVLIVLGLLVAFLYSRRMETPPEEAKVDFERSYTREEVVRLTVLGISGTLAFVLGFLGVMVFVGQLESIGDLTVQKRYATDFFVAAILVGIGPAGYIRNRENKRIQAIDQRLPEFLRDLAESQRTGMTLTQAVITASNGNYGALTPEIEKMAAQIEWGVSFDEALKSFAKRVDTPLVQRTVSLVIEASNAGGNVKDVLDAAAEDAREIQMIHSERRSGMQIYVMIIYIAFAVFLGVIGVLNVKFMPEVAKAVAGAEGVSVGSITFEEFNIQTFQTIFFHAAVIQGLGGGFVAGSMQEGKPVAGLKHSFAMTIIAYLTFRLFLGG